MAAYKFIITILFLLFLAGRALACNIPPTWTISTPDPCKTMQMLKSAASIQDGRWQWLRVPIPTPTNLSEPLFGNLLVRDWPVPFSCTQGPGFAGDCTGFTQGSPTIITFVRDLSQYDMASLMTHEMGHFISLRRGIPNWQVLGHGTPNDLYMQYMHQMVNMIWWPGDRYFPGYPTGSK